MKFARFFVDRPIFAAVLSIVLVIVGAISLLQLPVGEYPEVTPPSVIVRATYPGANPKVIAETVAAPLEQQINGVENMLYMSSQATSDGVMLLTVTFKLGTDVDTAQVQVQNRVSQALPKLPEDVRRLGVVTVKSSPDLTMVVHLVSPDGRYDQVYLRNYALLQVRDVLARLPGVGQVQMFGAGDYSMRVWLDPEKVASRGLTAGDVVRAIRAQNVQVAAGAIGAPPSHGADYQFAVNTTGRLVTEEQFGDVVVKGGADGALTRLRDVARIELGASEYALRSLLDNQEAVALPILSTPGANVIQISDDVRAAMAELKTRMPEGVDDRIVYDPTVAVRDSIEAVIVTLVEAILLVVLVVILFLKTWRASLIPLLAVPVSVVGTFAVLQLLGFSINTLSLFGLVLAIGIVVDDAIVVVENVERNIAAGLSPRAATYKAMAEVSGPIIAIALVLCAVFVPVAFISGLSGQFYRQFALTIAISTVISAFNSLTLSPALAALLLKPHGAAPDRLTRWMDRAFGGFFARFDRFFHRNAERYSSGVSRLLQRKSRALLAYAVLLGLAVVLFRIVPGGFVPTQDKQYLVAFAQLPDGASLDRTEDVIREMSDIGLKHPGVKNAVAFPGLSINGFLNSPNAGIVFFGLDPFDERTTQELSGGAIAQQLNAKFGGIREAFVAVFPPPPVRGLGTIGGFKLEIEDRADLGYEELHRATQAFLAAANQAPELAPGTFSSYQVNVPQLAADVDRVKALRQGVPLENVFEAMQVYLGSVYVNDFNRFGRTYQVIAQADQQYRAEPQDIALLKTRNANGEMVPLGSIVTVRETFGPDRVGRYNGYLAADVNGGAAPGYSSDQARAAVERIAAETLPNGIRYEWTDLTYQQILAGNTMVFVFPLCVLLVFLVLAALYESWALPLAVILTVPLGLLAAIAGVWLSGGDNNIFTQIAFFVLVGLASKNAILIVEFAKALEDEGRDAVSAAIEAARLRLRPILMTSIAFVAGVVPLVLASGAGAEMRHAMGVAVFTGMLGVTAFGLFLTPVFYVLVRGGLRGRAASVRLEPTHAV